jgi:general secretion pathway protein K
VRNSRASSGAILVAVLWSIALLSALAMAASTTFRGFSGIIALDRDRVRADAILTAGVEVAAGLVARLEDLPLAPTEAEIRLSTGKLFIRLTDEGGRIDIGKAPVEVLTALFRAVGAGDEQRLAEAVIEWRKAAASFSEQPLTEQQLFSNVRQLTNVPGLPPELPRALAPLTTVFGNATVNPLTAPAEVLAALPGVDRGSLTAVLATRARFPEDGVRVSRMLAGAQQFLEAAPPKAVRVEIAATLDDGFRKAARAVIVRLQDDSQPYRILAWDPVWSAADEQP